MLLLIGIHFNVKRSVEQARVRKALVHNEIYHENKMCT